MKQEEISNKKLYDLADIKNLIKLKTKTESEIIHMLRYSFNANNHNIFKCIDDIKILELIFQHTDISMEFFNNEFRREKIDKLILTGHPFKYIDSVHKLDFFIQKGFDIHTISSETSPFSLIRDDKLLVYFRSLWKPTLQSAENYMYYSLSNLIKYHSETHSERITYLLKEIPEYIFKQSNVKDTSGKDIQSPMYCAIYAANIPVIQYLFNNGIPVLDTYLVKAYTSIDFQIEKHKEYLEQHIFKHPYKEKLYKENKEELFRQDTKLKTFELLSQSNLDKFDKLSGIGYTVEDFETYLIQQNKSHLHNHLHSDFGSRKKYTFLIYFPSVKKKNSDLC